MATVKKLLRAVGWWVVMGAAYGLVTALHAEFLGGPVVPPVNERTFAAIVTLVAAISIAFRGGVFAPRDAGPPIGEVAAIVVGLDLMTNGLGGAANYVSAAAAALGIGVAIWVFTIPGDKLHTALRIPSAAIAIGAASVFIGFYDGGAWALLFVLVGFCLMSGGVLKARKWAQQQSAKTQSVEQR